MKNPMVIEDINENGTDWGVSRTNHIPDAGDYIKCASEEDANKLAEWLSEIQLLKRIGEMGNESLSPAMHDKMLEVFAELITNRKIV